MIVRKYDNWYGIRNKFQLSYHRSHYRKNMRLSIKHIRSYRKLDSIQRKDRGVNQWSGELQLWGCKFYVGIDEYMNNVCRCMNMSGISYRKSCKLCSHASE